MGAEDGEERLRNDGFALQHFWKSCGSGLKPQEVADWCGSRKSMHKAEGVRKKTPTFARALVQ